MDINNVSTQVVWDRYNTVENNIENINNYINNIKYDFNACKNLVMF